MSLELIDALLSETPDRVAAGWQLRDLAASPAVDGGQLLAEMAARRDSLSASDPAILAAMLRVLHTKLLREMAEAETQATSGAIPLEPLEQILDAIDEDVPNRFLMLHLIAMTRTDVALRSLVQRLEALPPRSWIEAAQVLSPLMRYQDWPTASFFPDALALLAHPSLAPTILDLANYLTRTSRVAEHPATARGEMLANLLGGVTHRLARFEEDPHSFGDDVNTVQERLGEAVSLAISLCDAIGLIGNPSYTGKLYQTLDLKHRRVQCEAAGALARLGEQAGRDRLIELAKEPAARLRAIAYADELGFGERIDEALRSDAATAESEMCIWLSQPGQMGVPPTSVEVVDSRRLLWPSFTDPVDVHLVRFEYRFGERIYSNVGITGPTSFALSCDVADMPVDDIYAIYAGWHAEHDDIFTVTAEQLNAAQKRTVEPLSQHLDRLGYEAIKVELLGFFLDETAAVFRAVRANVVSLVVTDGLETIEQPIGGRLRPLSSTDVFNLYKGRKMLRTFNS